MFIILKLSDEILNNTVGNIKYRNNVVTGVVAVDNGNNTYDCYISGADVAYPKIPTTFREPDFEVGEAVEILIEYGNKEMPIIIGHAKKVVQEFVEDKINVLVSTLDAYSVTSSSGYLEGRVEDIDGYENVIRQGFYYGTSTGYGSDVKSTGSFSAGSYNKPVTGLSSETTYHYQAYVHDAYNDVHTGEDRAMVTAAGATAETFVVYQVGSDFYLNSYDTDGTLVSELGVLAEITSGSIYNIIQVDGNNNIYIFNYEYPNMRVYKYDKDGTYVSVTTLISTESYFSISPNGYLYTLDSSTDNLIRKRDLSDLSLVTTYTLTDGHRYYYLTFDSDGYAYLYDKDDPTKGYVKWVIGTGLVTYHYQVNSASSLDSWVVAGDYVGCSASQFSAAWQPYVMAKAMNADRIQFPLTDISTLYKMSSVLNYFVCLGIDSGGKLIIEKYNTSNIRQWKTEIATSFTADKSYCGVGSYSF